MAVSGISFAEAVLRYGNNTDVVLQEIKNDLSRALATSIRSSFYARDYGSGVETLENEKMSLLDETLFKAQVMMGIVSYNSSAPVDRQVVTSQDLITVVNEKDSTGVYSKLKILVEFYISKDIGNPSVNTSSNTISVVV